MAEVVVGLDYRNPPVTEVVASVAFERLAEPATAQLAMFWWERLRSDFPKLEERAPYGAPIESFTEARPPQVPFPFPLPLPGGSVSPRFWATSETGELLLQMQPDWFACNWRRSDAGAYRHWQERREWFVKWLFELEDFLRERDQPPIKPKQCEVTYINHVPKSSVWSGWSDIWNLVDLEPRQEVPSGLALEQANLDLKFLFPSREAPVGRLHVQVAPGFDIRSEQPVFSIELTARGAPTSASVDGVLEFLDLGRAAVDRAFEFMTTHSARQSWGRANDD